VDYNVAYSLPAEDALCDVAQVPRGSPLAVVLAALVAMIRDLREEHPERQLPPSDFAQVVTFSKLLFCDACQVTLSDILRGAGYPGPKPSPPSRESEEATRELLGKFNEIERRGKPS
jgi:hypothetical protein